uniref:Uncharacterized protein n=1 Tax=Timema monikensis TaxID=170555 RepID=A0A7R9E4I9_9NEOP|nr:unnamed protein product [Timema monikensis]
MAVRKGACQSKFPDPNMTERRCLVTFSWCLSDSRIRCANQRAARGRFLPAGTTSNYSLQRHHGTTPIRTRRHQALEVIREEAVNEVCYTKRRKQLIPRARLAHWRAPSSTDSRRSSICSTQKRTEVKPSSQPTEFRQHGNDIPENNYAEIELLEVPPAFRDETETSYIQHTESGTKPVGPGSSDLKTEHKSTESLKEAGKSFTYSRARKTANQTITAKNKQSFTSNLNSSKIPSPKGNIEIIVNDQIPSSKLQSIPKIEDTNERTREENLPIVAYKNNEREMSRRPQILYIVDSTSSKSVANQIKNAKKQNKDVSAANKIKDVDSPNNDITHIVKTDEEILKTQEDNHVTSKLRTLFEENSNTIKRTQTRNPQINIGLNSVQTITEGDRKQYLHDEPNTYGESEEHFKPRIYATLSVEDVDTVSKDSNHKIVSSPLYKSCSFLDAVKRKSPPMEKKHTPAFRAFSCSGQKEESHNDLPISRILRTKNSSESEIFDQSHSISQASTKKGYQTLEMSKGNVNEGIKLDDEYMHKKEKQILHKDASESTKAKVLKSRKYSPDNKAAAFDGLLQYLQDYRHGLRELLVNNNVVIIEPIREHSGRMEHCSNHKIGGFANNGKANEPNNEKTCRITGATVKKSYANENQDVSAMFSSTLPRQQKFQQPVLRRHFFYHPKRTNRELVDEELPNPDTVKNARQVFEKSLYHKGSGSDSGNNSSERNKPNNNLHEGTLNKIDKRRQIRYLTADTIPPQSLVLPRWTDTGSVSSGVSSDLSYDPDIDLSSPRGNILSRNSNHHYENLDVFSSDDNDNSEEKRNCYSDDEDDDGDTGGHYVPPEVLDKIRACGTSVTYYGGHVIASTKGPLMSPMTLAIMDEIRKNNSSTRKKIFRNNYLGVKFRLVKSNSCGSRLELAGTEEGDKYQNEMEKMAETDYDENLWVHDICERLLNITRVYSRFSSFSTVAESLVVEVEATRTVGGVSAANVR